MSFGSGLGSVIGSSIASSDIAAGQKAVNNNVAGVEGQTQPFVNFGQSFMPAASSVAGNVASTAGTTQSYNDFMQNYTNTPAAQYQLQQANQAQNSSAAASGSLLSGANERALGTIDSGIVSQNANTAYNEYLQGNNQQFGQLTSALSGLLGGVGVGTTATGQDVSAVNGQNTATATLTGQQAQAATNKGNGIGSMFNGLGSFATSF